MNTAPRHQTVRLGFLWRAAGAPVGCVLALAMGVVLADTGAAGRMGAVPALLLSSAAVLGVALPVPYGFWLRADDHGLTLVRAFVPRRYRWRDIQGLTMDAGQDADSGAHRLVLLLRLTPAPRRTARAARIARGARLYGPVLGILGTTRDGLPRGTEHRRLAELFDLLRRHGVPFDDRRYADLVLTAHGYPALAHTAHTAPGEPARTTRPAARPDAA
ncbi:PH domain-containing protein [Kitasatospora sp. NPDC059817]|uniref:PH domain-containing protein n=1 Tax=Kitasatospora sp. NPDC059817 TaxID=3346961 RepID=UPI003666B199